jgi:transcriptional regulator with XRE-family HTH domain
VQNLLHPPAADQEARRAVAGRLRQAVRAAAGNRVVSERSGLPLGTINNYVSARTGMKITTLAKLAAACDVSLEWLITGDTSAPVYEYSADFEPPAMAEGFGEPLAGLALPGSANEIDTAMLAKAVEIVAAIDGGAGLQDDPGVVARRIAATYAILTKPSALPG